MKRTGLLFVIFLFSATLVVSCKKSETYNEPTATTATETSATSASDTTGTAAPLADADKDFVNSAGRAGLADVALAQDALSHAKNADVKSFAQTIVDDHTKANQELSDFATKHGMSMPTEFEAKLKEAKERLLKLTGASFDEAFVKQMVEEHQDAIKLFEEASQKVTNPELKKWIEDMLPKLREHLKRAQELQTKVKGKK